jgi:hypothetical protein
VLIDLIEPHYAKTSSKGGRPPNVLEMMLRINLLQKWDGLSEPSMDDALIEVPTMRRFAGIKLISDRIPDETTILTPGIRPFLRSRLIRPGMEPERRRHPRVREAVFRVLAERPSHLVVGLGLLKGQLQEKAITDGASTAAIAAPISPQAADGEGRPPLRWSRVEAMRSWDQPRSRLPAATMTTERWTNAGGGRRAGSGNAAAWATAVEDKLMGYRANEWGKLSKNFVAAGDGIAAFGVTLIFSVQKH